MPSFKLGPYIKSVEHSADGNSEVEYIYLTVKESGVVESVEPESAAPAPTDYPVTWYVYDPDTKESYALRIQQKERPLIKFTLRKLAGVDSFLSGVMSIAQENWRPVSAPIMVADRTNGIENRIETQKQIKARISSFPEYSDIATYACFKPNESEKKIIATWYDTWKEREQMKLASMKASRLEDTIQIQESYKINHGEFIESVFQELSTDVEESSESLESSRKTQLNSTQRAIVKERLYAEWLVLANLCHDWKTYHQVLAAIVSNRVNEMSFSLPTPLSVAALSIDSPASSSVISSELSKKLIISLDEIVSQARVVRALFNESVINTFDGKGGYWHSKFVPGRFYGVLEKKGKTEREDEWIEVNTNVSIADVYRFMAELLVLAIKKIEEEYALSEAISFTFSDRFNLRHVSPPPRSTESIKIGNLPHSTTDKLIASDLSELAQEQYQDLVSAICTKLVALGRPIGIEFIDFSGRLASISATSLQQLIETAQKIVARHYSHDTEVENIVSYLSATFPVDLRFDLRIMLRDEIIPELYEHLALHPLKVAASDYDRTTYLSSLDQAKIKEIFSFKSLFEHLFILEKILSPAVLQHCYWNAAQIGEILQLVQKTILSDAQANNRGLQTFINNKLSDILIDNLVHFVNIIEYPHLLEPLKDRKSIYDKTQLELKRMLEKMVLAAKVRKCLSRTEVVDEAKSLRENLLSLVPDVESCCAIFPYLTSEEIRQFLHKITLNPYCSYVELPYSVNMTELTLLLSYCPVDKIETVINLSPKKPGFIEDVFNDFLDLLFSVDNTKRAEVADKLKKYVPNSGISEKLKSIFLEKNHPQKIVLIDKFIRLNYTISDKFYNPLDTGKLLRLFEPDEIVALFQELKKYIVENKIICCAAILSPLSQIQRKVLLQEMLHNEGTHEAATHVQAMLAYSERPAFDYAHDENGAIMLWLNPMIDEATHFPPDYTRYQGYDPSYFSNERPLHPFSMALFLFDSEKRNIIYNLISVGQWEKILSTTAGDRQNCFFNQLTEKQMMAIMAKFHNIPRLLALTNRDYWRHELCENKKIIIDDQFVALFLQEAETYREIFDKKYKKFIKGTEKETVVALLEDYAAPGNFLSNTFIHTKRDWRTQYPAKDLLKFLKDPKNGITSALLKKYVTGFLKKAYKSHYINDDVGSSKPRPSLLDKETSLYRRLLYSLQLVNDLSKRNEFNASEVTSLTQLSSNR